MILLKTKVTKGKWFNVKEKRMGESDDDFTFCVQVVGFSM